MVRSRKRKSKSPHARSSSRTGGHATETFSFERAVGMVLALLSVSAGAIHFSVAGAHFEETFLHGLFFVVTAWFQILWGGAVVMRPSDRVWVAGAAVNGAVIITWIVSRTVGVPIGPNAGTPEEVSVLDVTATALEALIVLGSLAVLRGAFRRGAPFAAAALIGGAAAIVVATSAALAVGSSTEHGHETSEGHGDEAMGGHGDEAPHDDQASSAHGHEHELTSQGDEVYVRLQAVLEDEGMAAALEGLGAAIESDPSLAGESHQIVHALGRYSYRFYGDAPVAFSNCIPDFESGCYHGVLEAYLNDNPQPTQDDIRSLCTDALEATESQFVKFQCVHGLGHGLSLHFDHDLFQALSHCDYLDSDWERSSCYGGGFMENIIFAQSPQAQRPEERNNVYLKDFDPLYPCTALADRYLTSCYQMQTSAILWFNDWDVVGAFTQCDLAPADYIRICYESMGRDIGGRTLGDTESSTSMCTQGTDQYEDSCFAGVAKYVINRKGIPSDALPYCGQVPEASAPRCYEAIGQQSLNVSNPDPEQLCSQVPPAYVKDCRRGAGLDT